MAKYKKMMPPRNTVIRGQDHLLAYITPEEADLLKARGGTGEAGPMGIPAFDLNEGQTGDFAGNPDSASGAGTDSFADVVGSTIGGLFGMTGLSGLARAGQRGLESMGFTLAAHDPSAGGGTQGDGYDEYSAISRFYGGGGGQTSRCPEGYVYDEQLGACRLNTRPDVAVPANGGLLSPMSGAYARMGLLDAAPSGLADFVARYGLTGYATPQNFDQQNLAFRRQGATYPQFFKQPPLMPSYTNLDTGAVVPASGVPVSATTTVAPTVAPTVAQASPDDMYMVGGERLTPAGALVANIVGLGIDDPLIQAAQERLGPAPGEPWARALNIAAALPTPPGYHSRGQYLESLGGVGQAVGVVGTKVQDDAGRTIGYIGFERPEGDGGDN